MSDSHAWLGPTEAERAALEREVQDLRRTDRRYYRLEEIEARPVAERRRFFGTIEAARREGRLLQGPPSKWTPEQQHGYRAQLLREGSVYREEDVAAMTQAEREFLWLEIDASIARGDFVRRSGRSIAQIREDHHPTTRDTRRLVYETDVPSNVRDPFWAEYEAGRIQIVPASVGRAAFEKMRAEREEESRGR